MQIDLQIFFADRVINPANTPLCKTPESLDRVRVDIHLARVGRYGMGLRLTLHAAKNLARIRAGRIGPLVMPDGLMRKHVRVLAQFSNARMKRAAACALRRRSAYVYALTRGIFTEALRA